AHLVRRGRPPPRPQDGDVRHPPHPGGDRPLRSSRRAVAASGQRPRRHRHRAAAPAHAGDGARGTVPGLRRPAPQPAEGGPGMSQTRRSAAAYVVPPALPLIAAFAFWEFWVQWRDIAIIIVPPPSAVWERFVEDPEFFWRGGGWAVDGA